MKILKSAVSVILHLSAIVFIILAFWPIASWLYQHRPMLGVDFYNTATIAGFFRDFADIFGKEYIFFWYTGSPAYNNIILFWFRAVGILAKILPLITAIKFSLISGFILLLAFLYLASYRLSRNHLLSATLAILTAYSVNMYGSWTWGGSLPYFLNQLFLPFMAWCIASYLATGNRRWFWLGTGGLGLSFWGHMANSGAFIVPLVVAALFLGKRKVAVSWKARILDMTVMGLSAYFIAYPITKGWISGTITGILSGSFATFFNFGDASQTKINLVPGKIGISGDTELIAFERSHFQVLFSDTSVWLLYMAAAAFAIWLILFFLDKQKRRVLFVLPWGLLVAYSVGQVLLNAYGIKFVAQAWYRAYWHFPIFLSLFIAAVVGYGQLVLGVRKKIFKATYYLIGAGIAIWVLGFGFITGDKEKLFDQLTRRSEASSAFPEALNLMKNDTDLDKLKKQFLPSFISPDERNYRIYLTDAQVAVWWNSLFSVPQVRGYLDPVIGSGLTTHHFLLDQVLGGNDIVNNYRYPEDIAVNMGLFYLDWYAVKYAEGGHLSKSPNKTISTYMKEYVANQQEVESKGAYYTIATKSGKPEINDEVPQFLKYSEFNNDVVTPVVSAVNSPVAACFCNWSAYESLTKILSYYNINSRKLVTLWLDRPLDEISESQFQQFDVLILNNYLYRSKDKAFRLLKNYVEQGGKLLIDTGGKVGESMGSGLPEIFPFTSASYSALTSDWQTAVIVPEFSENIVLDEFAPLIYEKSNWKISFPKSSIKTGAETLLTLADEPVIIRYKIGRGSVVWTGLNLAYHINYTTNFAESLLYLTLLKNLVELNEQPVGIGRTEFTGDKEISFTTDTGSRGLLVKQQLFDNWQAKVNDKVTPIYPGGPTAPGFMYIPTQNLTNYTVNLRYLGNVNIYIAWILMLGVWIIVVEQFIFNGKIFGHSLHKLGRKIYHKIGSWWEKEE